MALQNVEGHFFRLAGHVERIEAFVCPVATHGYDIVPIKIGRIIIDRPAQ